MAVWRKLRKWRIDKKSASNKKTYGFPMTFPFLLRRCNYKKKAVRDTDSQGESVSLVKPCGFLMPSQTLVFSRIDFRYLGQNQLYLIHKEVI